MMITLLQAVLPALSRMVTTSASYFTCVLSSVVVCGVNTLLIEIYLCFALMEGKVDKVTSQSKSVNAPFNNPFRTPSETTVAPSPSVISIEPSVVNSYSERTPLPTIVRRCDCSPP